jgi:hypothetical protein
MAAFVQRTSTATNHFTNFQRAPSTPVACRPSVISNFVVRFSPVARGVVVCCLEAR